MKTWLRGLTLVMGLAPVMSANASESVTLPLYETHYVAKVSGFSIKMSRTLTREDNRFTLSQGGGNFLWNLHEESHFRLEAGHLIGDSFEYQLGGISKRRREVQFDEAAGVIRSLKKKQWTEHPWSAELLDRLSIQEQVRLLLLEASEPMETISLTLVDGPKINTKTFELIETVVLDTPVGKLNTVHYRELHEDPSRRSSDTWLAVDHSYLMVKTVHDERGTEMVLELTSGSLEGADITGLAPAEVQQNQTPEGADQALGSVTPL